MDLTPSTSDSSLASTPTRPGSSSPISPPRRVSQRQALKHAHYLTPRVKSPEGSGSSSSNGDSSSNGNSSNGESGSSAPRSPTGLGRDQALQELLGEGWFKVKERLHEYVLKTDLDLEGTSLIRTPFASVFDGCIARTVKQNFNHIWCLEDTVTGWKFVVSYTARLRWVKRITGKLDNFLRDKGYKQDKLMVPRPGLEVFHNYVPNICQKKTQKESFASLFLLFVNDGSKVPPRERRLVRPKMISVPRNITSAASESPSPPPSQLLACSFPDSMARQQLLHQQYQHHHQPEHQIPEFHIQQDVSYFDFGDGESRTTTSLLNSNLANPLPSFLA